MPRIVNGNIVNDEPEKRKADKPRIMTWNDISSHNTATDGNLRNRASNQSKHEDKKDVVTTPPPASVIQYISNMLGLREYNLKIPQDNPTVVLNAAYFVVFLFFTFIFGWKMALIITIALYFMEPNQ